MHAASANAPRWLSGAGQIMIGCKSIGSRIAIAAILLAALAYALAAGAITAEDVAAELANPLAPITTLAAQVRAEYDNGPDKEDNYQLRLQPSFFKPFADRSALLVRAILPLRFNQWPGNDAGLGDLTLVPYYVPDITRSTFVGYGGALILPTASGDSLGSATWSAGPAVIYAKTGKPITWGGLLQHVWSFAGDADRGDVSVTTVQPFFTYLLRDGWSATVTSETVFNWKAASGQEWTVPLALGVAKVAQFGSEFVNFGLAHVSYAERPGFVPRFEIRLTATYVLR